MENDILKNFKDATDFFNKIKQSPNKTIYLNSNSWARFIDYYSVKEWKGNIVCGSIPVVVDMEVEDNEFLYCEPGLFEIWKMLKTSPRVKITKDELLTVADSLYEAQKKTIDLLNINSEPTQFMSHHEMFWDRFR